MDSITFRPLKAEEIDVKMQTMSSDRNKVNLFLSKDERADQNILDETVGCYNWQRTHSNDNANCIVSVWDNDKKQWIAKEAVGSGSNSETAKSLANDSFKQACTNWGIGRELYTIPPVQIDARCVDFKENNGKLSTLDKFFVYHIQVSVDEKTKTKAIAELTIGIEHEGWRDWAWKWSMSDNKIVLHIPDWVKNPEWNKNQTTSSVSISQPAALIHDASGDVAISQSIVPNDKKDVSLETVVNTEAADIPQPDYEPDYFDESMMYPFDDIEPPQQNISESVQTAPVQTQPVQTEPVRNTPSTPAPSKPSTQSAKERKPSSGKKIGWKSKKEILSERKNNTAPVSEQTPAHQSWTEV